MKRMKIAFAMSLMALSSTLVQAQTKEPVQKTPAVQNDTVLVMNMKEFREFASAIDQVVDSKDMTRKLIALLEQKIQFIPKQPVKEPEQPKKKE